MIVAALVAASFIVGLVRPWDWLAPSPSSSPSTAPVVQATTEPTGPGSQSDALPSAASSPDAFVEPTCAYPSSWRIATISDWVGHRARTWQAAEVAAGATGPTDPSLHVEPVISTEVLALGWCAPVSGPERPPRTATGTLYRIVDGVAEEVPYRRLEPAGRNALGELWVPGAADALGDGTGTTTMPWNPGRYVIRIADPAGTYVRWLALEVATAPIPPATPAPPPSSPTPGPS